MTRPRDNGLGMGGVLFFLAMAFLATWYATSQARPTPPIPEPTEQTAPAYLSPDFQDTSL